MNKIIVIFICILLTTILVFEAWEDSGTYDEVAHITAGYTYLYKKDFRLYPDNPPLIKMLSVLPWIPQRNSISFPQNSPHWNDPLKIDQWTLGREFLYQSNNDADHLIFLSRLPIIALTILLGILVYIISSHFFGPKAGLFSLFLFALSPDIRAHGHLATTDVGATFFALLASFLFYVCLTKKVTNNKYVVLVLSSGFIFALALLSKYSMVLLFLSCITIAITYAIVRSVKKIQHEHINSPYNVIKTVILVITITFISLWSISLATGYSKDAFSYKNVPLNEKAASQYQENIGWIGINALPLPYYYKTGLHTMYARNILTQPTYLFGIVQPQGGWKIFFPLSYLLKTPLPILIFLFSSVMLLCIHKSWKKLLPCIVGGLFFCFITLIGNLTIGTRFYYPATVLFIITASTVASFLFDQKKKTKKLYVVIWTILCIWLIATNIQSFPYDISYVNELGGTTKNGYNALVDSSYDWGQDLKRFRTWYKKNANGKTIKMSYLGTADPSYYGIKYSNLQFKDLNNLHGLVAISITNLKLGGQYIKDHNGNTIYDDSMLNILKRKQPMARIGTTIFVYEFK